MRNAATKCAVFARSGTEISDHRHRWLLRPRRERPSCCAAEQRDELAAFQAEHEVPPLRFRRVMKPLPAVPRSACHKMAGGVLAVELKRGEVAAAGRSYALTERQPSQVQQALLADVRSTCAVSGFLRHGCFTPETDARRGWHGRKVPLAEINRTIICSLPKAGRLDAHFQRTTVPQGLSFGSSG